jgi:hypothetical protein
MIDGSGARRQSPQECTHGSRQREYERRALSSKNSQDEHGELPSGLLKDAHVCLDVDLGAIFHSHTGYFPTAEHIPRTCSFCQCHTEYQMHVPLTLKRMSRLHLLETQWSAAPCALSTAQGNTASSQYLLLSNTFSFTLTKSSLETAQRSMIVANISASEPQIVLRIARSSLHDW